jgi:hypothetical protein
VLAPALWSQKNRATGRAAKASALVAQRKMESKCARVPPVEMNKSKHTDASSRNATGGQIRCEGVTESERTGSVGRGNALRSHPPKNPLCPVRRGPSARPAPRTKMKPCGQTQASHTGRASLAWSCSNHDRGDRGKSTASSHSIALPALGWSRDRSRTHKRSARP